MFCSKCGQQIADNSAFCSNCGQAVAAPSTPAPSYEAPQTQAAPDYQSTHSPLEEKPMPMGWFKFLIYFALWAGAVLNLINAVSMLNGTMYGGEKEAKLVYALFEDMQTLDTICGAFLIVVAIFGVFTRFQLSGFKKNGPTCVTILYIGVIAFDLAYIIGCTSILPEKVVAEMNFSSMISSIAISAAFMFYNISYFKQRAHLFVN